MAFTITQPGIKKDEATQPLKYKHNKHLYLPSIYFPVHKK